MRRSSTTTFELVFLALLASGSGISAAQEDPVRLAPIVVTPTRIEQSSFDLPVSIDAFNKEQIQQGQAQVNLSETLIRAPGIVANTRQNYAQDLQVSIRGFGARSTFGIRGVRLYADGIPLTMPDGQGQAANVDLSSAKQIEVMRGPFSALYGNSSGGVINVFTEDGPEDFTITGSAWAGSFDSSRVGLKIGGQQGVANYLFDVSRFDTEGFRDHSAATRDTANGKVRLNIGDDTSVTLIANYLNQPETQDPLGLTRAQMQQNREQAGTGAVAQDTRKSIENSQAGAILEKKLSSEDSIRVLGYAGKRTVQQFLALTFAGRGVVDLNRDFEGVDLRWTRQTELADRPFTFTAGVNYDAMNEARKGFTNVAGQIGALGRDEDNTVFDFDQFVQAQWDLTDRWSVSGGVRHSTVKFKSEDHFTTTNGDDSGDVQFSETTPVAGVVFKVSPVFNLYANAGKGFETPTFAEMAYRSTSATSTGLNFGLKPAESNNYEIGAKAYLGSNTRLNAAIFKTDTKNEIVVLVNQNGRSVYQNVDSTSRKGFELAVDTKFGGGFTGTLAYTYLDAKFDNAFLTCGTSANCGVANLNVPAGNKIPGVPANSVYGEIGWSYSPLGFSTAVEARWVDKVFISDLNDESADAYALVNLRASLEQKLGGWKFTEFARVDNIFDEEYVGSVIVNASNGASYEPAPGTNYTAGVSVSYQF